MNGSASNRSPLAPLERLLLRASQGIAVFGGAILLIMTLLTLYSVIGRYLSGNLPEFALWSWWRPIRGDFELVEFGTAVAILSFFPYTQMVRGNVLVDFFTANANPRFKAAMSVFSNALYTVLAGLFTWRMALGTHDLLTASFQQTTMLLRLPLWWGFMLATILFGLLTLTCLFTALRSVLEMLGEGEPEHTAAEGDAPV